MPYFDRFDISSTTLATEEDFQAALDRGPSDATTRLVLADWLDERGDPRADGYRALAATGARLVVIVPSHYDAPTRATVCDEIGWIGLPHDWAAATWAEFPRYSFPPAEMAAWREGNRQHTETDHQPGWCPMFSRRHPEDAAARAFARLPPERRAELLAG